MKQSIAPGMREMRDDEDLAGDGDIGLAPAPQTRCQCDGAWGLAQEERRLVAWRKGPNMMWPGWRRKDDTEARGAILCGETGPEIIRRALRAPP